MMLAAISWLVWLRQAQLELLSLLAQGLLGVVRQLCVDACLGIHVFGQGLVFLLLPRQQVGQLLVVVQLAIGVFEAGGELLDLGVQAA